MDASSIWSDRFRGRGFIVTGAQGGIGRAVVDRLAAEGAVVLATDAKPAVSDDRANVTEAVLDVTDPAGWRDVVAHASRIGADDGLLICHGITHPQVPVTELSLEDWRRVLDVNLTGCFLGIQSVLPVLKAKGWGRIVALASIAAKEASVNEHAYAASKAALVALVKSVGKEVATAGVTANTVAPGPVGTELYFKLGEAHHADRMRRSPMKRVATPEEAAALITWLASPEASHTTAQCYDLSGGRATY